MNYGAADERWANPPQPVAAAEHGPSFDHSMVSEEYEHDKKKNPAQKEGISFSQALLASGHEKSDGKIKLTARSFMEVGGYAVFLIVLVYGKFVGQINVQIVLDFVTAMKHTLQISYFVYQLHSKTSRNKPHHFL